MTRSSSRRHRLGPRSGGRARPPSCCRLLFDRSWVRLGGQAVRRGVACGVRGFWGRQIMADSSTRSTLEPSLGWEQIEVRPTPATEIGTGGEGDCVGVPMAPLVPCARATRKGRPPHGEWLPPDKHGQPERRRRRTLTLGQPHAKGRSRSPSISGRPRASSLRKDREGANDQATRISAQIQSRGAGIGGEKGLD